MALVRMNLSKVIISETEQEQMVVLKEVDGQGRAFPILIGIWEAAAISRHLAGNKPPRPMTHDLICGVIRGLGFELDRVVVNDLREGVFFARLVLRRGSEVMEVDSRPSDAIAVAVRMSAPIFVSDDVIEEATRPSAFPGLSIGFEPEGEQEEEDEGEQEEGQTEV